MRGREVLLVMVVGGVWPVSSLRRVNSSSNAFGKASGRAGGRAPRGGRRGRCANGCAAGGCGAGGPCRGAVMRVGPSAAIRPLSRMMVREVTASAMSRSCVAMKMVLPSVRGEHSRSTKVVRLSGSSALVGSSSSSTSGSVMRVAASATRFFSPPESRCGGRVRRASMPKSHERSLDAVENTRPVPAELQGAEGQLVEHRGAEQLDIRVLEHEADALAEAMIDRIFREGLLGQRLAAGRHAAGGGEAQRIEQAHQRGLAGAIGAENGDALARCGREADGLERRKIGVVGETHLVEFIDQSCSPITAARIKTAIPSMM